jgi:hypothetical protein
MKVGRMNACLSLLTYLKKIDKKVWAEQERSLLSFLFISCLAATISLWIFAYILRRQNLDPPLISWFDVQWTRVRRYNQMDHNPSKTTQSTTYSAINILLGGTDPQ